LDAATVFTDTLYLDAENNSNAVFIIKINGALSTSTYSKVILINGAQAKNVYWKIEGAVILNNYSVFCGTIVCNNGALGAINTGVILKGRAFTTTCALTTTAITTTMAPVCTPTGISSLHAESPDETISFYPNPFTTSILVTLNDESRLNIELKIYNVLGKLVISKTITSKTTALKVNLPSGIYFYRISGKDRISQSGKLVAQ
ncbi:MAG: ice-binding family protein, partial [Bacteroidia bacterium]